MTTPTTCHSELSEESLLFECFAENPHWRTKMSHYSMSVNLDIFTHEE